MCLVSSRYILSPKAKGSVACSATIIKLELRFLPTYLAQVSPQRSRTHLHELTRCSLTYTVCTCNRYLIVSTYTTTHVALPLPYVASRVKVARCMTNASAPCNLTPLHHPLTVPTPAHAGQALCGSPRLATRHSSTHTHTHTKRVHTPQLCRAGGTTRTAIFTLLIYLPTYLVMFESSYQHYLARDKYQHDILHI